MKKRCSKCGPQDISLFNKNKAKKDGLCGQCRSCMKGYLKDHYRSNTQYYIDKKNERRQDLKSFIRLQKEGKPCTDCKLVFHFVAMQFDHLPGNKKEISLAHAVQGNWSKEEILAEIAKCEIVCSNCHAIRTYERRQ